MQRFGPWEPSPTLAVAVSGGADSTALALLAQDWAASHGGTVLALIVDHGLRPESGAEAAVTRDRLAERGMRARVLAVNGLRPGPALAERARAARYDLLLGACNQADIGHLLLGHHARDQAETVMTRALGGSGPAGLAGMAAMSQRQGVRLLRPLLDMPPIRLRSFLTTCAMPWIEDPSNTSPLARRARLRRLAADERGDGPGTRAIIAAARVAGEARRHAECRIARILAERVTLRPEGHALLSPGPIEAAALAALLRTIAGAAHPLPAWAVGDLARDPRPATLAGVRLMHAGRLGPGWLVVRELRHAPPPVPAVRGAVWDGRFRLVSDVPEGLVLDALGSDSARLRRLSDLPAAVLRTLPVLRRGKLLAMVPHLDYRDPAFAWNAEVIFDPPVPMAGAPFLPATGLMAGGGCATGAETLC